jgi:hypothetical protein
MISNKRDLCINRHNHQKPTFHPLGDFLNPALTLLGQGLKKSPLSCIACTLSDAHYLAQGVMLLLVINLILKSNLNMMNIYEESTLNFWIWLV